MGMLNRIADAVRNTSRRNSAYQEITGGITVNALCSAYENFFAQLRPLIDEMKTIEVYGAGRNGARLPIVRTPELAVLQDPNDEMGYYEFLDAMFATWLSETELNVHVHRRQNGKVYGYSILPPNCRSVQANGEVAFQVYSANGGYETFTRDEVMTLRFSRSPRNIDEGVSPASSAFTWSQIDDLMAQYQKAYLENGAIPASITIIRASTQAKFEEARKEMDRQYGGARNKNKTLYIWRQFNNDDGSEKDQVEVKTIQGNNSTLAIKELIDVINDRLNKAVGVSNFILGDDSSAKYDNAELSDLQFTKRRVYPALMSFWGQFQHELDRITGGLGYAIQFDLEIPELTDRLKTKAETAEKNANTLKSLIEAGARPSAAVDALELPESWRGVADGIYSSVLSAREEQATRSTTLEKTNITNSLGDSSILSQQNLVVSKTDTENQTSTDSTTLDAAVAYPIFAETEIAEKHVYDELMKIAEALANEFNAPVQEVIDAIMEVLVPEADGGATVGAERIADIVKDHTIVSQIKSTLEGDGFHVSDEFKTRMQARVSDLVSKYEADTQAKLQNILDLGRSEGLSAAELQKEVSRTLPLEMSHRAATIARNETVHAFRAGRLANDEYIANRFDLKIAKVWKCRHDGNTCEICQAMDGVTVALREPFPEEVEGADGLVHWDHTVYNVDGEEPNAHTNCRCYFNEVIVND